MSYRLTKNDDASFCGRTVSFAYVFLLFALCGCYVKKQVAGTGSEICGTEPLEITLKRSSAFLSTVSPLLRGAQCVNCHDGNSGKAPYPHSSSNPLIAYRAASQLVDFTSNNQSRLVKKILSNHNCGDRSQCNDLADEVLEKLFIWADEESKLPPMPTCPGSLETGLTLTLPAQEVKSTDLSKTTDKVLRWDMRELNASLGKMVFSINLRSFTDRTTNGSGSYQMSSPILATETEKVKVVSVTPLVNGKKASSYANYSSVNFVVEPQPFDPKASVLGFPPISDFPQQIVYETPTLVERLGFVVVLQSTSEPASHTTRAPGCKAPQQFKRVYDYVFDVKVNVGGEFVGQCTRCHGDPNAAANAVMNLSGNGVDPCLQALMRTNLENPIQSLILTKPSRQDETAKQNAGSVHPAFINLLDDPTLNAQKSYLLDWIRAEANQGAGN